MLKFAFSPTQNPNASQWNIGCPWVPGIGSLRWACTFHIFCVDFICIRCPTQTQFSVEYGLKLNSDNGLACNIFTHMVTTLHWVSVDVYTDIEVARGHMRASV